VARPLRLRSPKTREGAARWDRRRPPSFLGEPESGSAQASDANLVHLASQVNHNAADPRLWKTQTKNVTVVRLYKRSPLPRQVRIAAGARPR
jgi:hypothetical protein